MNDKFHKEEFSNPDREESSPKTLHVGRPNIGDKEDILKRVEGILDRKWLTNQGPMVQEFEQAIADFLGVKHCIAMCNGTVALEIAIRALGLSGEVILPSFTFIATAHALQWQEITPVFCDIEPKTFCVDPSHIERHITPRTTGIIGVHLWGRPCDTEALQSIADKHGLALMYDAAHAFACEHSGRSIGNFGRAEVFSFHATKFFNTLEGGAIVTNDDKLAEKVRLMKNFGFGGQDKVIYIGTNGKMNEISAAVGLSNLKHVDEFIAVNKKHYETYLQGLQNVPGLELMKYSEEEKTNYQYITLIVQQDKAGISRDELQNALWERNIRARRYFYPGCHRMEPYRSFYPQAGLLLPQTEEVCDKILQLPTGTGISKEEVQGITEIIRDVAKRG